MSDPYCPPPDPSKYLESGIEYEPAIGKESTKSLDDDHNRINYEGDVVGKSPTSSALNTTTESINKVKETLQIAAEAPAKLASSLSFGTKSAKTLATAINASNIQRKVVNEI